MLTWFAISGILIFITATSMAVILLAQRETFVQTLWGMFCVLVAFWGIAAYNIGLATDPNIALWWWKIGYIGVAFIPTMFTHFVYEFLGYKLRWPIVALYALSTIYLISDLFSGFFMAGVHLSVGGLYFMSPTPLYDSYMLMWIFLIPYAHILLYREFRQVTGERREQIKLFFIGSFIGFFGGSFSFLPEYHLNIYPYPNLAVSLYPLIMGYAILKYRLWNFKVLATQASVLALWVFLAARVILSPFGSQDQIIEAILLLLTVIVGILLIRSVNKEIEQRETIQKQAEELRSINAQQENLLHFISHEIKGYLAKSEAGFAAIAEGDFGEVTPPLKEMASTALSDVRRGVRTVMDILDASNLKKGTVSYEKALFDLKATVLSVADDLRPSAEEKGLHLEVVVPPTGAYTMEGDEEKIRGHVIRNLIDNSIKYTPSGKVTVGLSRSDGTIRFVVEDTGVGITEEDKTRLFTEGGHGKDSIKVNVHSTGYGLYIAKQIVEAHGGKIWAESDGPGKGSRFIAEFSAS